MQSREKMVQSGAKVPTVETSDTPFRDYLHYYYVGGRHITGYRSLSSCFQCFTYFDFDSAFKQSPE